MREIVIVISDLYLAQDSSDRLVGRSARGQPGGAVGAGAFPGIEWVARFGKRAALEAGGWRPWLARWLGRGDLAGVAPARVVAAGVVPAVPAAGVTPRAAADAGAIVAAGAPPVPAAADAESIGASGAPPVSAAADAGSIGATGAAPISASAAESPNTTPWIATPVHLIAGLTNIHVDRRSILRLPATDLDSFAADFNHTFGDSALRLTPLASGDFVLQGPATFTAATTEPARALVSDLEASLPKGGEARALKRFGAELEMWLHASPLNETRRRRGELPVSTLWLWGGADTHAGGDSPSVAGAPTIAARDAPNAPNAPNAQAAGGGAPVPTSDAAVPAADAAAPTTEAAAPVNSLTSAAYGTDPYLAGLWRLNGDETHPLPEHLSNVLEDPQPQRAVLVIEVTPMLHHNPHWTVLETLAEIDRRFVSPAIAALRQGTLESVVLIANDLELRARPVDRFKIWRRPRPGIAGLLT